MGVICDKCLNRKQLKEEKEQDKLELIFPKLKSSMDEIFKKVESMYNPLEYFQLYSFILLLNNIKANEVSSNSIVSDVNHYQENGIGVNPNPSNIIIEREHLHEITKEDYLLFIQNKVLKHFLVSTLINDIPDYNQVFQDYSTELYGSWIGARGDFEKRKNPEAKIKKPKSLKKLQIYPYALLFCNSNAEAKMEFLFSLFVNDKKQFTLCEELREFLYYLFITPSTCSFRSIKRISEKFPTKFDMMSSEEYLKKLDAFEVDDIVRLKDIFIKDFFEDKLSLTRKQYDDKIILGSFSWIFSASGIRLNLEKNNVPKSDINQE
jgi:hypothetical protein